MSLILTSAIVQAEQQDPTAVQQLAKQVADKDWIVYSSRTAKGDWDLFLMRPDGSRRRNITNTPDANEAAARFSHDGRRLLFRRLNRESQIDHCFHGQQGHLVISNADGTQPIDFGRPGRFPWASWGPKGKQLACLSVKGIEIIDIQTKRTIRKLPRKGIFQRFF